MRAIKLQKKINNNKTNNFLKNRKINFKLLHTKYT